MEGLLEIGKIYVDSHSQQVVADEDRNCLRDYL